MSKIEWKREQAYRQEIKAKAFQIKRKVMAARSKIQDTMKTSIAMRRQAFHQVAIMHEQIESYLEAQSEVTEVILNSALAQSAAIASDRGQIMHDAMVRGFDAMQRSCTRYYAKLFLRRIKRRIILRLVEKKFARAKLRSYCRICAQFIRLDRSMPRFYRLKLMYKCYMK